MKKARNNVLEGGITMVSQAEYIYAYLSENMFVPTVMFWVAIAIAITSVVCFILAPLYSKGKHGGVKVLAQINARRRYRCRSECSESLRSER